MLYNKYWEHKKSSHIFQIPHFQDVGQLHISRKAQRKYENSDQTFTRLIIFCTPTKFSNISISKNVNISKFNLA